MFVNSGSLPHLLPPAAYTDADWFARERAEIFERQWQPFCLADQVAKDGAQFAGEVLGVPVVVFNRGGRLYALKNVCAHRHSQIVPGGAQCGSTLRCQIHGWEYDESGSLAKMTDGRSFKGFKVGGTCLASYRAQQAGPLVFVNLDSRAPSFEESLGGFAEEFGRFYQDLRHISTWQMETPVNWKVIVENAVESYHVPMVHPNTFQDYRPEELHDHHLAPTYSRYGDLLPYESEKGLESLGFRVYTRLLIRQPTFKRFTHVHVYPNHLLYFGDIFRAFNSVEPLGPERSRITFYNFVPRRIHWGLAGRMLQDLSMVVFLKMGRRILQEDVDRWPPVQKGLRHATSPGVLSCREERVFGIQRYVAEQLGMPVPSLEPERSPSDQSPVAMR
ncbi:aromatic ring-hydroxylating oxygenase subunit alpha [Planctomyces sp. SH-PL14]|uniref:aromatic ring-hydroxylating oxygenase subunit alpha n=1 Tax=Planctomyces sp. SH-PL14 TaxID=1632864 RepID=UPI00078BB055|nr:aromatic ring-hydroxylating dioxygenase subunit alpha [Planctomyces sp. SH-PL14]AMV18187.1 2-halobenzoate 1,2-dioxygenase large subunit [Planctomyces sp. SH-PL14]